MLPFAIAILVVLPEAPQANRVTTLYQGSLPVLLGNGGVNELEVLR